MLRVVRLGTPRLTDEGLRIGTVRRPPRGVPKARFATDDWYDVWFPTLAPSAPLMQQALAAQKAGDEAGWMAFDKAYRAEMAAPDAYRFNPPVSGHADGCGSGTECRFAGPLGVRLRLTRRTAMLHWIWTILIGFLVGLVARSLFKGGPSGFLLTAVLGIAGSVFASFIGQALGLYAPGNVAGFIMSVVGAIALLWIWRALTSKSGGG